MTKAQCGCEIVSDSLDRDGDALVLCQRHSDELFRDMHTPNIYKKGLVLDAEPSEKP